MAQLQLNKASLARETARLRTLERFLPSLDLKRQQLMAAHAAARRALAAVEEEIDACAATAAQETPMLAAPKLALDSLVELRGYTVSADNIAGARAPRLESVDIAVRPYSPMSLPHWVDDVARLLAAALEAQVRREVAARRADILAEAVETITQRVNLFAKVLIPNARANIKRIRIHLSDAEMAAVVRSKIAKRKRAAS